MPRLEWSWLAAPYVLCALAIASVAVTAALIRGDRVLRLGMVGAAAAALPWAVCSAIVACTHDRDLATHLLRLGIGPVALIGPDLFIVLLGISGQLERRRWLARIAAGLGGVLLAICWATEWTVPGVRELASGMLYQAPGPLAGVHSVTLAIWIGLGLVLARRATPRAERRRMVRLLVAVLTLCAVGATDTLLVYGVANNYPIAWLPATVACVMVVGLMLRTDILRPRGFDRGALIEIGGFIVATLAIAGVAFAVPGASPLPFAALGSLVWVIATGSAWALARRTQASRWTDDRTSDVVSRLAELGDEGGISDRLGSVWKQAIGIEAVATWLVPTPERNTRMPTGGTPDALVPLYGGPAWQVPADVIAWLARHPEPLAVNDLATMRLGTLRAEIEALGQAHGASLLVPLVDRGELVAVIEALYERALRESERGFVETTARAAARQLTFVRLSREAARERDIAREVEVADAMRLVAAGRDDELGRWSVVAGYRSAARTTGAAWSASLLDDGRLALLVTEAQARGVPAALSTAALSGAFTAATTGALGLTVDALLDTLRASVTGVIRGSEPIAFVALLDADASSIEWATAGHPGAHVMPQIDPRASLGGPRPKPVALTERGTLAFPADHMLVVASTALRRDDWVPTLLDLALAGPKLATLAVETSGQPDQDLLCVAVRRRV